MDLGKFLLLDPIPNNIRVIHDAFKPFQLFFVATIAICKFPCMVIGPKLAVRGISDIADVILDRVDLDKIVVIRY